MTPIEKMAFAIADSYKGQPGWHKDAARAALLALSECELPEEIAQEGGIAGHVMDITAVDCFRAMLRAIANAPSS